MRFFHKKPTQEALNALKYYYQAKKEHADWNDNSFNKAPVRTALVAEQGHLCAYCMQRIEDAHTTTIEHWEDRASLKASGNNQKIFEYNNLLAVCKGHLYRPDGKDKHCDASRSDGNRPLSVKPSEQKTLDNVGYLRNGRIYAKCALNDLEIKANSLCSKYQDKKDKPLCDAHQKCDHCDLDCDKGLNLNVLTVMNNRKKVLTDLQITLERFCKNPDFAKNEAEKKRIITNFVNKAKNGALKPYIGIVEFFYKKYL
jgi:uncharacterized protein (TIGR02646 family)